MTSCPFSKLLLPGPAESQKGLPAAGLQPPLSETMELVAVKDFTDDN